MKTTSEMSKMQQEILNMKAEHKALNKQYDIPSKDEYVVTKKLQKLNEKLSAAIKEYNINVKEMNAAIAKGAKTMFGGKS